MSSFSAISQDEKLSRNRATGKSESADYLTAASICYFAISLKTFSPHLWMSFEVVPVLQPDPCKLSCYAHEWQYIHIYRNQIMCQVKKGDTDTEVINWSYLLCFVIFESYTTHFISFDWNPHRHTYTFQR